MWPRLVTELCGGRRGASAQEAGWVPGGLTCVCVCLPGGACVWQGFSHYLSLTAAQAGRLWVCAVLPRTLPCSRLNQVTVEPSDTHWDAEEQVCIHPGRL